jgi:hypothetical protein
MQYTLDMESTARHTASSPQLSAIYVTLHASLINAIQRGDTLQAVGLARVIAHLAITAAGGRA